jgi:hypothetical protein
MEWVAQYKKRVLSRLISVEPTKLKEKIIDSEYYLISGYSLVFLFHFIARECSFVVY